jgi:hypothetical protein
MDNDVDLLTFLQKRLKSSGIITILFPSPFTIFIPSLPISSKMSFVAGSKSEGMSYVPNMINLARDLSGRYLNLSPRSVFMIGALCARERRILHSRWIACLMSSWTIYSLTSPFTTRCTLRTLGLCRSFTVHLIIYHICLLSSRLHFCLIAATLLCCFLVWALIRQSHK